MLTAPNPFREQTRIEFSLEKASSIVLDIYSVDGSLVSRLADGYFDKGTHNISWGGIDPEGRTLPAGIYFLRISDGESAITRKVVLLR